MDWSPEFIVEHLEQYVSEQRRARIEAVINQRTNTVVPVIEGLANSGNISAVMRSAEAMGLHQFHIIENNDHFKHSERTSKGAEKWLTVQKWATPNECVSYLHSKQYKVVVTHLDDTAVPIQDIDFTKPTAFVFGNEKSGASQEMLDLADQRCIIPMNGFVESFNISVAAAIGFYHAYVDRIQRQGKHGDLSDKEKLELRALYYQRSVNQAERILNAKC
ncbi:MAG: RNA methyltransferase [Rhodothermaceae bacterium]|nr:RNA methyltransferase [Rhodothermaceae bacterium]